MILFVVFLDRGGFNVHNLSTLFSGPTRAGGLPDGTFRVVDVLAFGALGAFFAVSADIKSVKINHSISIWEMLYAGFVRVPIGVIAAAVVILMISGGWILAAVDAEYQLWAVYLFGFLAGFSELFVPNALKKVESTTDTKTPAAAAEPG